MTELSRIVSHWKRLTKHLACTITPLCAGCKDSAEKSWVWEQVEDKTTPYQLRKGVVWCGGVGGGSAFATSCQVSDYTQLRYNGGLSLLPSLPSVAVSAFLPSSSFPVDSFYSSVNTNKIPCFFLFCSFSFVNFVWKACITTCRGMTSWDTLAEWEARRKDINLISYMSIKLYLKSSTTE